MKKRTRRKVWALVNPVQHAIDGAVITPQKLLDELRMLELAHLAAMRDGTAGLAQWRRRALKAEDELETVRQMRVMDNAREMSMARSAASSRVALQEIIETARWAMEQQG